MAAVAAVIGIAAAGCGGGGSDAELASAQQEVQTLQGELATAEKDAAYWQQLTSLMQPVDLASMSDHRAYMLPSGVVLALHFDNMDLAQAENLNWLALGVPGRFCKEDQERVTQELGTGFTHFHDMANDVHGGEPGAEGVWFVHVGVRDFEAPWGAVAQGIDENFMPTDPPACGT